MNKLDTRYIVSEQCTVVEEINEFDDNESYEKERPKSLEDRLNLTRKLTSPFFRPRSLAPRLF